jgi:hypothetical protein
MDEERLRPHLRLVEPAAKPTSDRTGTKLSAVQPDLFPMAKPHLLIFANATHLSEENVTSLILQAQPTLVLDLRPFPRFDFGRLNRKAIFDLFQKSAVVYLDVTGLVGITSRLDANFNPCLMVSSINDILNAKSLSVVGPILFLFDDSDLLSSSIKVFPDTLMPKQCKKWDVCVYP